MRLLTDSHGRIGFTLVGVVVYTESLYWFENEDTIVCADKVTYVRIGDCWYVIGADTPSILGSWFNEVASCIRADTALGTMSLEYFCEDFYAVELPTLSNYFQ